MLKLYGCPRTRSLRATWALEEAGAEYQYIKVDLMQGDGRARSYLRLNPAGKVPTLVDGDLVLAESAAIVTYLGEKFPASTLVPIETHARAEYFQWLSFTISELEQPLWSMAKHRFGLPENLRIPAMQATAAWEFSKSAKILHHHLKDREYVAGEYFSAADILVSHTLAWARSYEVALESEALESYADRMFLRPALAAARQRELA